MAKTGVRTTIFVMALLYLTELQGDPDLRVAREETQNSTDISHDLSPVLSVSARTTMQTGTLPRPILWAEPGSVIPLGRPLTFWCQGASGAQNYVLKGSKSVQVWNAIMIPESGNKAKFTISEIQQRHARRWECQYCEASRCSMYSDELKLMVTGFHDRPSLSALPSPVVPLGENVTLQCGSPERFRGFILIREGKPESFWVQESQPHDNGLFQALFPVGPVGPGQNWTFSCYGHFGNELVLSEPSNVLQLLLSGSLPKATIWAEPGSVIPFGSPLTVWCQGIPGAQNYILRASNPWRGMWMATMIPVSGYKAKFSFVDIQQSHTWNLGCTYCMASGHCQSSKQLKLMVTGFFRRPSLSALPSPVVPLGENVTLKCGSSLSFEGFVLIREGKPESFWVRESQRNYSGLFHALFPVGPVGPGQNWTFRCYGHFENELELSYPSNVLQLLLSGSDATTNPAQHTFNSISAVNLTRILLGVAVLIFLGILLFEALFCQGTIRE